MIEIVKLANGEIVECQPFEGVMYGSDGLIITLLAIGVDGGKLKTEYFVLSTK